MPKGEIKMAKRIVGYKQNNFTTKEGNEIIGFTVYLADEEKADVVGVETDSFYLTEAKLAAFNLDLESALGKAVYVRYNNYGKPSVVRVMEDK